MTNCSSFGALTPQSQNKMNSDASQSLSGIQAYLFRVKNGFTQGETKSHVLLLLITAELLGLSFVSNFLPTCHSTQSWKCGSHCQLYSSAQKSKRLEGTGLRSRAYNPLTFTLTCMCRPPHLQIRASDHAGSLWLLL